MLFTSALFIATAVLAVWLDHRLPRLAPRRIVVRGLCVVVTLFVCGYVPIGTGSYVTLYSSVFGLLAPLLVLMWLSALWLLKAAVEALESRY